ncbi:MAG: transcription-repair coupling factor [Lachnospiraceae bacterium]
MLKTFLEPLTEYREFVEVRDELKKGKTPIQVTGCIDVQKCHFMHAVAEDYKYRVIVTYNDLHGRQLYEQYKLFDSNVCFYPAKDFIFFQADIQGNQLVKERMCVLEKLIKGEPCTVITSIDGGMDKRLPLKVFQDTTLHIDETSEIDLKLLEKKLVLMGYEKQVKVENHGEFSIHGGIIDVFPLSAQAPYRIELWGDEVDTIRVFDAASQRSIEKVNEIYIFPAVENIYTADEIENGLKRLEKESAEQTEKFRKDMKTEEGARLARMVRELRENIELMYYAVNLDSYITSFADNAVSFFDYFPSKETVFYIEEPARVYERGEAVETEYRESMSNRLEKGYVLPSQVNAVFSHKEVYSHLDGKKLITVSTLSAKSRFVPVTKFDITAKSVASYQSDFSSLVNDITTYKKKGYRILLVSGSKTRAARLAGDLTEYELNAFYTENPDRVVKPGEIMVVYGQLGKGFEYPLIKFVVITESDIFGVSKTQKKASSKPDGRKMLEFNQLAVGDYVIHENHGMGIYRGIYQIETDHVTKDYIKLEYAAGGILYVPVTALDMMQKYAGADSKKPKLNKLNSSEWKSTKSRVKASVNDVAEELVELYAKRQAVKGYAFSEDTLWQKEFEEMFPYEETKDQLKAIEETKADMESEKIMDRLICGDVGYGKTEIAIRAAFKAVQDSKQVAVLVPTTILAQQHYNTFVQRLKDFPVKIEVLSRFRSSAEQKAIVEKIRKGQVDIVIGTHRLLSKDIAFKNLGLLVVDEEQRFGVTHKEKIKQMKNSVDVLTLSATPIPRTMHMSLIGIRDMSVLDEPPIDRLPIQTYVMEHNDELIREAIVRELTRGGQVYVVSNRVVGIEDVAAKVSALVPDARVAYAHGRMNERVLEKIMFSFINGEIDVLVSTTIIETGMDISNVNTIIIDDADRFGLSQLYQLRGRVGRSNRTAYAFLMYKKDKILREEAEKRLSAIKEFTELGAGYKIAMKDLEIRGAGNLLGERQSGHMSAVGYDLYCKMLNEAVKKLKGEAPDEEFETSVDMDVNAYIPSSYIRNEVLKLDMYKKIATITGQEDLEDMQDELIDRFGDIPVPVETLLQVSYIRGLASKAYVTELKQKGHKLELFMYPKAKINVNKLTDYVKSFKGRCRMTTGTTPVFTFALLTGEGSPKALTEEVVEILNGLIELTEGA